MGTAYQHLCLWSLFLKYNFGFWFPIVGRIMINSSYFLNIIFMCILLQKPIKCHDERFRIGRFAIIFIFDRRMGDRSISVKYACGCCCPLPGVRTPFFFFFFSSLYKSRLLRYQREEREWFLKNGLSMVLVNQLVINIA